MNSSSQDLPVLRDHRRQWRDFRYVYPVVARRSRGLSVGVNLNPDKRCTFGCIYCQVDRKTRRELHDVDLAVLRDELRQVLREAVGGQLWQEERFAGTPAEMRRVNDIAFSGDGEPTLVADFDKVVALAAEIRREMKLDDVKLVVITNATQFDQEQFTAALPILEANNGEIWAKLDAGSEEYFARINHPYPKVTLAHILRNIARVAREWPLVIQSLFLRYDGQGPSAAEVGAYCDNLRAMIAGGAKIKLVQVHTIARMPASAKVTALSNGELDAIVEKVRAAAGTVAVEAYYGSAAPK